MRRVQAAVLASGSAGNCVWVEAEGAAVLVDCGLTVPGLKRRLADIGRDLSSITDVFVTHEHGDHVGSSVALARRHGVTLHATAGTHSVLRKLPAEVSRTLRDGETTSTGPFDVRAFSIPHDGRETVGYRVTHRDSGRSMAVVTDLGFVTRRVVEQLQGVHLLVCEHNHDERMLVEGPYPAMLKRRIASPLGHLSNGQGAALVRNVSHPGLQRVVLAHLSETNNTPDAARRTFEKVNRDAPASMRVDVARQDRPCGPFEV